MAELDKIIKQLEVLIEDTKYSDIVDLTPDEAKTILELLKEQPKIVRCMNCKWNSGTASYPYCQWFSESKPPIWFCANGELKE